MRYIVTLVLFFFVATPALALEADDPLLSEQWYLDKIQAKLAWDITTGSSDIVVAVLDSGVDMDHPDLSDNLWVNTGEIAGNNRDDDGNGFIDDVQGWDFVRDDNNPSPATGPAADEEAAAHGSLVSGLVGAVGNNAMGVSGVAWDVQIMPLRALNNVGTGLSNQVADAIDYAVQNGADVINLSFSGPDTDMVLANSIEAAYEAGVTVVAALGNENEDTDISPVYPGCYGGGEEDWVIGVAATDQNDQRADFSNYGKDCADLSAPGVDIFGLTYHGPSDGFVDLYDGGWTGTSMSTPLVAGAAALILSEHPEMSPDDVKLALQLSVDPVQGPLRDEMGAGRLNVARALEVAALLANGEDIEDEDIEVEQSELVDVGESFKAPSFSDTYVYTETGGRRVYINALTYFTYEQSFDDIIDVADEDLGVFPLEGLVLPKAGTVLVKIPSVPTVYALEENPSDPYAPLLRAIEDESIAVDMYGSNWNAFVLDVDVAFFGHFGIGEDITSPEPIDISIMKTREELAALAS